MTSQSSLSSNDLRTSKPINSLEYSLLAAPPLRPNSPERKPDVDEKTRLLMEELLFATEAGDPHLVKSFLKQGALSKQTVNYCNFRGETLVHLFVRQSNRGGSAKLQKEIRDIIANLSRALSANLNSGNINGMSPLAIAVDHGNLEMAEHLLQLGAEVDGGAFNRVPQLLCAQRLGRAIVNYNRKAVANYTKTFGILAKDKRFSPNLPSSSDTHLNFLSMLTASASVAIVGDGNRYRYTMSLLKELMGKGFAFPPGCGKTLTCFLRSVPNFSTRFQQGEEVNEALPEHLRISISQEILRFSRLMDAAY